MTERIIESGLDAFMQYLLREERSKGTVEKYLRDVRQFAAWLGPRELAKEETANWREELLNSCSPATVNSKLAALNSFFHFAGRQDCRVNFLKLQHKMFRDPSRELGRGEYERLLRTAQELGKERLALVLETVCSTGIRVSELPHITVEALEKGRAEIFLKGKIRTILLPNKLCRKLRKYARKQKIVSGEIFLTRSGARLSRKQIWAEMKALCSQAGVEASKVFPHNLRHLFARCFYHACRDIAKLADVLGHSNVETTRIYLISSGEEHAKTLERLKLVS